MDHFAQGERLDFERRVRDAMPERYDQPREGPSGRDLLAWKKLRELDERVDKAAERFALMTDALHEANRRIAQLESAIEALSGGDSAQA